MLTSYVLTAQYFLVDRLISVKQHLAFFKAIVGGWQEERTHHCEYVWSSLTLSSRTVYIRPTQAY